MEWRSMLKYVLLALVVLVVAVYVLRGRPGEYVPQKYFYDLSEQRLYAVPRDAFPPGEGIGGEIGDGVEAIVIGCPESCASPDDSRIAYLKSHTPEYKAKREEAEAKGEDIPGLTRAYIAENTLIRLVDDTTWHPGNTRRGAEIVSGWKVRCSHGAWVEPLFPQ